MIDPETGCPSDYGSLYENYFTMIKSIVVKSGINPSEVEDVAMELLVKFMEKDALSWYDPNLLHDVGENPRIPGPRYRPAKFQGLLRGFCRAWVRQHLDKQALRLKREAALVWYGEDDDEMGERKGDDRYVSHDELEHVEVYDAIRVARSLRSERISQALRAWTLRQSEIISKALGDRQRLLWEARREAQREIEHALQREQALIGAATLAVDGVRVTGSAVARLYGWPAHVGVTALKGAREDLKAVGL